MFTVEGNVDGFNHVPFFIVFFVLGFSYGASGSFAGEGKVDVFDHRPVGLLLSDSSRFGDLKFAVDVANHFEFMDIGV